MWIIKCIELRTNRSSTSGRSAPTKLQAEGHVSTDVQSLVEPDRALAGATF